MELNIAYYTARGMREVNQDAVTIMENDKGVLAVVADGLGGHDCGEVASDMAVKSIIRQLQNSRPGEAAVAEAVETAGREIFEAQKETQKMRTTVAVLWIDERLAISANVGDTRIYQMRDNDIIYQSTDHSVAQMAVLVGELAPDRIRQSPDRNKLIRVLGDANTPKVDTKILYVKQGDRFLLCSDGFWGVVTEEEMLKTLSRTKTANEWLAEMRWMVDAFADEKQDNHTAIAMIVE